MLWLFVAAGLAGIAIMAIALGLARNTAALLGPADFLLFAAAVAVYLLPTALALYRNCTATGWIIALDILLGWTIFGWFAALGWAAAGKTRPVPPSTPAPPVRPVLGH